MAKKGSTLSIEHKNNISKSCREMYDIRPELINLLSEKSKTMWANDIIRKKIITSRTGLKRSDVARLNISKSLKGKKKSEQHIEHISGENNGFYGKHHTEATIKIIRDKSIEMHKDVDFKKMHREATRLGRITHGAIEKWIENRRFEVFPFKDTKIEVKIQDFLSQLHIEYLAHKYISEITHKYQCDIFIPIQSNIHKKIIIECDGCFYHACSICNSKETEWTKKRRDLDEIRTKELIDWGYNVIRLWEHEIKLMQVNDFKNKLEELKQ